VWLGYREVEDRAFGVEPGERVERAAEIGDTWIINPHATLGTIG